MKLVEVARRWVGREFRPGVPEQCMGFVRAMLAEAQHPLADKITAKPVDGLDTGFYLASSLAGRDLGPMVDRIGDLRPGAILFFQNTYGDWPRGTITHVGIYAGDNQLIHRPTMSRPVEQVALVGFWRDTFRAGLLVPDATSGAPIVVPKPPTKIKLFAKPGKMVLVATEDLTLKAGQELSIEMLSMEMIDSK